MLLPYFQDAVIRFTEFLQPGANISAQIANSHTLLIVLTLVYFFL